MTTLRVSFPHMGNYFVAAKPLAKLIADEVIEPPQISKLTLELGLKHSPECACIPFKYNLGNFIEALDKGANVLVQAGGGCRFGYYGEVQESILRKLGYDFHFIKFTNDWNIFRVAKMLREFNPKLTFIETARGFRMAYARMKCIDALEDFIRLNIGFEREKGSFEKTYKECLTALDATVSVKEVQGLLASCLDRMKRLPIDKPEKPMRIGVIGELYILMEPYSNFSLEKELARRGIEVHRFVTVSTILHETLRNNMWFNHAIRHHLREAAPYLKYHIGAHGTESVAMANRLIKDGFDGVIHIKPFGCMPEVSAMSALQRMSKEHRFPIMYLSFDSQTSETGLKTRIEAFYDMLMMKKHSLPLHINHVSR